MPRTSLAERMSRLEQQKARLAGQEAKLKAEERKQRTRRLVEAGTLVEKAGLLNLNDSILYGALLSLSAAIKEGGRVAEWAAAGRRAFGLEEEASNAAKEPLIVSFPAPLPTPFSTRLRAAGLRWNKLLQHWQGMADHDAVATLAAEQNGAVTRVRAAGHRADDPQKQS